MEITGDGGQGGGDDRLVECGQEHPEHEGTEDHQDPAVLSRRDLVVPALGRRTLLGVTLFVMIMPATALVLPLFLEANAVHALLRDPRFPPATPKDLPGYRVEISVLSPFVAAPDPTALEIGVHGLRRVNAPQKLA